MTGATSLTLFLPWDQIIWNDCSLYLLDRMEVQCIKVRFRVLLLHRLHCFRGSCCLSLHRLLHCLHGFHCLHGGHTVTDWKVEYNANCKVKLEPTFARGLLQFKSNQCKSRTWIIRMPSERISNLISSSNTDTCATFTFLHSNSKASKWKPRQHDESCLPGGQANNCKNNHFAYTPSIAQTCH